MTAWYLEGYLGDSDLVYRIPLNRFPAIVGRQMNLAVTLHSNNISRQHAEFLQQDGQLLLHDLGSTNGTYVNHDRVTQFRQLNPGDVIRFAELEFRLRQEAESTQQLDSDLTRTAFFATNQQVNRIPVGARQFEDLLAEKLVVPLFQPIVSSNDERITGMELLGRGCHPDLAKSPIPLFYLADSLGQSVELSETIREVGVRTWADSAYCNIPLFVNTSPRELEDCRRLTKSLEALHIRHKNVSLVLEIHEQAVTDGKTLSALSDALEQMDITLAYDDFGAGQARLLELLNIPPYAVKFDITLIHNLHKLPIQRQEMISLLVTLVKKGHTLALAEGVSHPEEAVICRQLGFDLMQGYAYGKPTPVDQLAELPYW